MQDDRECALDSVV